MPGRSNLRVLLLMAMALAVASAAASHPPPATAPVPSQTPTSAIPPANTSGMVWVNTDSGAYHKPGSRYYGRTKHGKYMLEADAIKAGYHAASKK